MRLCEKIGRRSVRAAQSELQTEGLRELCATGERREEQCATGEDVVQLLKKEEGRRKWKYLSKFEKLDQVWKLMLWRRFEPARRDGFIPGFSRASDCN